MPSHSTPAFSVVAAARAVYQEHGRFVFARIVPICLIAVSLVQFISRPLTSFIVFLAVVPLSYGVACTIALAPLQPLPDSPHGQTERRRRHRTLLILFALQALMLFAPWAWLPWILNVIHETHKNDYVAMIGSGDTPEEAAVVQTVLLFFCVYPLLLFGYYVLVPMLLRPVFTPYDFETPRTHRGCLPVLVLVLSPVVTYGLAMLIWPFFAPMVNPLAGDVSLLWRVAGVIVSACVSALLIPLVAIITVAPYQSGEAM